LIDDATGTFQGLSVTSYPRYSSPVLSNSGTARPLTPTLNRQMQAMIAQETGDDPNSDMVVLTSNWDAISWDELYENAVRITPETSVVGLNRPTFQSSFGRFTIVTDPDTKYGVMYFIDRSQISYMRQRELDWRRYGGNGEGAIFQPLGGSLGHVATALQIGELMIEDRRRCGKIEDLKNSVKSAY
jgi:hypothetical protein